MIPFTSITRMVFCFLIGLSGYPAASKNFDIEGTINILNKHNLSLFKSHVKSLPVSELCAPAKSNSEFNILNDYKVNICNIVYSNSSRHNHDKQVCYFYQINTITVNDKIIFYEVFLNYFANDSLNTIAKFIDSFEVNLLKSSYQNIHNIDLRFNELFDTKTIYGKKCGYSGFTSDARNNLEVYVKEKNNKALFALIQSPSLEYKLYGYEGYQRLQKMGYLLSPEEQKAIMNLININSKVRTCIGCIFFQKEFKSILQEIDKL